MSEPAHEGVFIGAPERRLFAVFRPAVGPVRAAFVLCPPFFHEQFLSYRLLSMIGVRLAARGVASLRFDYFGTGDSAGEETEFSLAGAIADTETALAALRERVPATPLILCGARAGAWPAAVVAVAHRLPLWLWQPLPDGAQWVTELEQADARERASLARYPFLAGAPKQGDPDRLLASYCPPSLRAELAKVRLSDLLSSAGIGIDVVDDEEAAELPYADRTLRVPHATAVWHAKIDIRAAFVSREIGACIDALGARIGAGANAA